MLGQFENLAVVGPFALEHRAGVVQGVGQDMDVGLPPRHQRAIKPDKAIAIVIGSRVSHGYLCPGIIKTDGTVGLTLGNGKPLTGQEA